MYRGAGFRAILTAGLLAAACNSGNTPNPTPTPPGQGGNTITGRERIGWDQATESAGALANLEFAIYVDGVRSVISDVSCAGSAGPSGFACSGRLPAMTPGVHSLQIASFRDEGSVESERSAPLQVTVAGATAGDELPPLTTGETITTNDGIALLAERVAADVVDLTDVALSPDGRRIFTADGRGRLTVIEGSQARQLLHIAESDGRGGLLAIALAPDFTDSGHLYTIAAVEADGRTVFRLLRYRVEDDRAVDRMVMLPDVLASGRPSAALRFGPDHKLYAAFDSADEDERATRPSEWNGKILRLEPDGRTPRDQPAASPVLWSGIRTPRGLAWTRDGTLWAAEDGIDGSERLRAIDLPDGAVRRASGRRSFSLPRPFGGRGVAAYDADAISGFTGNLFLAGADAGYLLRITFDDTERGRPLGTERLLEGRLNMVRAVAAGHDGSLYFCTGEEIWRLRAASAPPPGRAPR